MDTQRPTIGRIVHYTDEDYNTYPAIVMNVHSDFEGDKSGDLEYSYRLDLAVFWPKDTGKMELRLMEGVTHGPDPEEWIWPPRI